MNKITIALLLALYSVQAQSSTEAPPEPEFNSTQSLLESKCLEKEGLTMNDVKEFYENDKLELGETNKKLKCLAACFMEYNQIMVNCKIVFGEADNGPFSAVGNREEFSKLMDACKGAAAAGERCECGYQLVKCFSEYNDSLERKN